MLNIGPAELMVILVIALLVLGPNKLPDAARQVGRAVGELRRLSSGFQAEMRDALKEPVDTTSASGPATSAPEAGGALAAPRAPAGEPAAGEGGVTLTATTGNGASAAGATEGEQRRAEPEPQPDEATSEPGANGSSPS